MQMRKFGTICWKYKIFMAKYIMEAEFIVLLSISEKVNQYIDLLYQSPYIEKSINLILINYDSTNIVSTVPNHYYNGNSNHEEKYYIVRSYLTIGTIKVDYVKTYD